MVIPVQEELKTEALKIAQTLRNAGMMVEFEVMGRKMAKALEDADRRGINYAVIVGEREFKEGRVMIKDLKRREQSTVEIGKIREAIKNNA
jgi:histidyl-tRNA synthetase